jgi:F-type H+-transporting ATPase subunit b
MLHEPEVWILVAFLIVIGIAVWRKVPGMITRSLDERATKIKAEIEEAQRLREEAQQALALYQQKQRDALKEAEQIVVHAKAEAERLARQAARDLEASLERRQHQAEEKIAQAEAKALAEVRDVAVDVAIAATRGMLAEQLQGKRGAALIDDAIAALPQKLH